MTLPTFLNPWTAAAAAGAFVPLLLALYFLKLRRQERLVSSTLLWRKAIQDLQVNAPFQRLRRNLLLFLQLLLILLLCLALARPVIDSPIKAGKLTVLLIDRSASMGAVDAGATRSRLEQAKRRAAALVDTMDRDASAMVIAFDDSARIVQSFTADAGRLKAAIDAISQTDRRSRLKLAYKMAEAPGTFVEAQLRPNVAPDVFLFSDGRVADADELRLAGNLTFDKIGSDRTGNIAIVALSAKRNYERPTEVQIFARLANFGPDPVSPMVQLSIDGQVAKVAGVDLLPQRWDDAARGRYEQSNRPARDSVEFTVELPAGAVIKVEQTQRDGDALPADDAAWVVVPPPRPLRLMLVTDGNYYLEKIVRALHIKDPAILIPSAYEAAFGADDDGNPARFDAIIFDRYQPQRLPDAGGFIYFGVTPPAQKLAATTGPAGRPQHIDDVSILDWRRDHPLLRYLSLARIYVAQALKLHVPPEAQVLVDGTKGPLVVLQREGRRTHLVVAFDLLQSTWPVHHVSFPLFMHNAMQFLALGADMAVRQSHAPGDTPAIPRTALQKIDPNRDHFQLVGPELDQRISVAPIGEIVLPALDRVGLYHTDPPLAPHAPLAVNLLDDTESNLLPLDHAPGGVGATVSSQAANAQRELWWYVLAAVALPLLLIEWFIYTRRAHL